MQTSFSFNKPVKAPQMLFGFDNINDFGNEVKGCRMEGDSMQPTIELCEAMTSADCRGRALTPGIYVLTDDVSGRSCLFVGRIEPLLNSALRIISDNLHY